MKRAVQISGFITIAFLLSLCIPEYSYATGWYDANWHYRKSHTIISSTGPTSAGPNYQVMITVHYAGTSDGGGDVYCNSLCRTDFGDIRFTSSNGTALLNYWMETYTVSGSAVFWVQVSNDLSSNQIIYIYYGNSSQTTTNNGPNTFPLFYTDWEDNQIDGWTFHNPSGTGSATVGAYFNYINQLYQLRLNAPDLSHRMQESHTITLSSPIGNPGVMIEGKMTTGATPVDGVYIGFSDGSMQGVGEDAPGNGYMFAFYRSGLLNGTPTAGLNMIQKVLNSTPSYIGSVLGSINGSTVYKIGLSWTTASGSSSLNGYVNRSPVSSGSDNSSPFTTFTNVFVSCDINDKYYDWVFVRKYVNPEPTHGTWSLQDQPMVLSSSKTDASCYLKPDGTASVSVTSGGSGSFTYSWTSIPPQLTATASGLPPGTYAVTVTDDLGQTASTNATVGQPNAVTATMTILTPIDCNGNSNGIISVAASGGTPGSGGTYDFSKDGVSWTGLTANPHQFTNLNAGTYKMQVKDNNGCLSPEIP